MVGNNVRYHIKLRKELEEWLEKTSTLDIDPIRTEGRYYEKIRLGTLWRAEVQASPRWLIHYLAPRLEETALRWNDRLHKEFGPAKANVWVWIFERDLLRSQVVCDFGPLAGFYERTFDAYPAGSRHAVASPPWRGHSPFEPFLWEKRIEAEYKYAHLDELSAREMRRLSRGAVKEIVLNGRKELAFEVSRSAVWVGSPR
jgi:hypothetical protein